MSALPADVAARLRAALGRVPGSASAVGGGMINQAARVEVGADTLFVKWRRGAPAGFFEAEADGLRRLARTETFRVPVPIAWADAPDAPTPFLAMEYIETCAPSNPRRLADVFGERLAEMHRKTSEPGGTFGLERGNFIGILPQRNAPTSSWPEFYRDRRILPQIETARLAGRLPPRREQALMAVCGRLDELLPRGAPPCLIHGDLWSGNFLTVGDETALVDPAVYRADREVEVAYVELFGGFPPGMLSAYRRAYPLAPGYGERRLLLQLFPLLVHLNHFGEQYGPDVDRACAPYAA